MVQYDLMLSIHMMRMHPCPMLHLLKLCQCEFVTATHLPYRAAALVQMCTKSFGANAHQMCKDLSSGAVAQKFKLWCNYTPEVEKIKALVQMRTR